MSLQGHLLVCLETDEDEGRILIFGKRQLSHPSLGRQGGGSKYLQAVSLTLLERLLAQILLEAISENMQGQ